jgi:hypothetical protein
VNALLLSSILAPFFFEFAPEVRSTYQSLGKIVEDRPMQVTSVRAGYDTGSFGRFGIRNWDVSSLTGRRYDAHRHALYHTEFGPTWQFGFEVAENWKVTGDLTRSWTIYRGFRDSASDKTYHWWQLDQSLENPYLVPFYRIRKCFRGNDYFYFKIGIRRRFGLSEHLSLIPSLYTEGGSSRNQTRVLGKNPDGETWNCGVSSVSARLECVWRFNENVSAFMYVEQYEVVGNDERNANDKSSYRPAHNDWTHGGIGLRLRF